MNQDNGGIIGKLNTPTTTVASGVWTLQDQFEAQASSIWPLAFPQITIANSCRFNDDSSDRLIRTQTAGNRRTYTISFWIKRSGLSASTSIIGSDPDGSHSANFSILDFNSADEMDFSENISGTGSTWRLITNRKFRDVSAWYNIVCAVDTTQATASNRLKIFINGVQETSFSTENYPSQNLETKFNENSNKITVGGRSGQYFDGYFAEVVMIDGTALDPTSFGVFNTVSNIWEPRGYAGTYGTNGFRLDFADSSALGNDVSGNDNDFTVDNLTSIDQSTDTCSNNFAILNPLAAQAGSSVSSSVATFSDGNLVVDAISSETIIANIGVDTGKWFWEVKVLTDQDGLTIGGANQHFHLDAELGYNSPSSPSSAKIFAYYGGTGVYANTVGDGNQFTTYGTSVAVNDIVGVALNLDDNQVTFYKNGTAQNSGTAASLTTLGSGEQYFPAVGNWSASNIKVSFNFGSPSFSISSGNADANGFGNFEYAVPSGYFSLCTKNLAEFG
jgi:hypothetical protein